jgi:RNA recognition motif-containing protein
VKGTKTLYVGNLPWAATEEDLARAFANYRVRSVRIIHDRETGRSRGFGFVEIADEDMERAIREMEGYVLGDRVLVVNEAQPRTAGGRPPG